MSNAQAALRLRTYQHWIFFLSFAVHNGKSDSPIHAFLSLQHSWRRRRSAALEFHKQRGVGGRTGNTENNSIPNTSWEICLSCHTYVYLVTAKRGIYLRFAKKKKTSSKKWLVLCHWGMRSESLWSDMKIVSEETVMKPRIWAMLLPFMYVFFF